MEAMVCLIGNAFSCLWVADKKRGRLEEKTEKDFRKS